MAKEMYHMAKEAYSHWHTACLMRWSMLEGCHMKELRGYFCEADASMYTRAYMYMCMYAYECVYNIYALVNVCMYVCSYVCMDSMYAHTRTHTHT